MFGQCLTILLDCNLVSTQTNGFETVTVRALQNACDKYDVSKIKLQERE